MHYVTTTSCGENRKKKGFLNLILQTHGNNKCIPNQGRLTGGLLLPSLPKNDKDAGERRKLEVHFEIIPCRHAPNLTSHKSINIVS